MDLKKITMFCPYGSITNIKNLGVNPSGIKERDVCAYNDDNKVCSNLVSKDFKNEVKKQIEGQSKNDLSYPFEYTHVFADYDDVQKNFK